MKRPLALALFLALTAPLLHAAPPPPQAATLKAANIDLGPTAGGWSVAVRDPKTLTEDLWNQIAAVPDLKRFQASGKEFDDAALAHVAKLKTVETVFLNDPGVTDAGLAALAQMPALKSFGVDHSQKLNGSGLVALRNCPNFTAVHFGGCSAIGDHSVESFLQLPQLKSLQLGHTSVTKASFPLFAKMPALEALELSPQGEPKRFTAADLAALAPAPSLHQLSLADMALTWEGGLTSVKSLTKLTTLNLGWCYISDADLAALKAGLPAVKVDVKFPSGEDKLRAWNERLAKVAK